MTDLEKISRPILYNCKEDSVGHCEGYVETSYGKNVKYTFSMFSLGMTFVNCFSLCDDSKSHIIAGFRVTKIHDTRRENN